MLCQIEAFVDFIAHVTLKDPTEHTGVEAAVASQLASGSLDWFPDHKVTIVLMLTIDRTRYE